MRATKEFTVTNTPLAAAFSDCQTFDVAALDVLQLDMENLGNASTTGFKLLAKVAESAPYRDITPASLLSESQRVFNPASTNPAALPSSGWTQLGINVTDLYSLKVQAAGSGALLRISSGGYEVKA